MGIERRRFLQAVGAVAAGCITDAITTPAIDEVGRKVSEYTDHPTGNAAHAERLRRTCMDKPDPDTCIKTNDVPLLSKIKSLVISPPAEEFWFRALPSYAVSELGDRANPAQDVFLGTRDGLTMTRREVIVGAVTSVAFGAAHNYLGGLDVDTKTIPVETTLGGGILWYLQRKLGVFANTAAHIFHNTSYFLSMNRK